MAAVLSKGSRGDAVKKLQACLHLVQDGIFGDITLEAVIAFQKANGLKPDGIVGEKTWAKLNSQGLALVKSKRVINKIIVHCTATPEGRVTTVDDIRLWHKQRGFSDIGYHYVVYLDGTVHNGRDVNLVGAHCSGYNANSIGVCYVGGCDKSLNAKDTRNEAQKAALLQLLKRLRTMYPNAKIHGHRDFSSKPCPSFDAKTEYKYL